jgi:hypothetical protein
MGKLIGCCILSVLIYVSVFRFVPDRPLSLGALNSEIQDKAARMENLPTPKLVILAGSNGPYSHSCLVISSMLNLPCENAGIAVGIGLDQLFSVYEPDLHSGDIVYMPLETAQYIVTRSQNDTGPDGPILLARDGIASREFPIDRVLGAFFSISFLDVVESLVEYPIARSGFLSASRLTEQEYNAMGDRIGTSLATADQSILEEASRREPDGAEIARGYGSRLVRKHTVNAAAVISAKTSSGD